MLRCARMAGCAPIGQLLILIATWVVGECLGNESIIYTPELLQKKARKVESGKLAKSSPAMSTLT